MACRYRDLVTLTEENRKGRWSPEECNALQEAVDQYMAIKQVGAPSLPHMMTVGAVWKRRLPCNANQSATAW